MARQFVYRAPIGFGDVDSARILFYPRFFEHCHRALEYFSEDAFGITYAVLLDERKRGFPTVHIETDYHVPFVYGDVLEMDVDLLHLGRKSLVMRFRGRARGDERLRVEARITKVCVDMDRFEGVPIEGWIRAGLEPYLVTPPATPTS